MVSTTSTATRAPVRLHVPVIVGEIGRVIVAGLDGLLGGLIVGFVALTAIGAPANHLGLPWPLAILVIGLATGLAALLGALLAMTLARAIAWVGRHLTAPLARRGHPRVARLIDVPFRVIAALPAGRLGAFGVLLLIVLTARDLGPLGLLMPLGILSTFVWAAGLVGAMIGMARAVLRPRASAAIGGRRAAAPGRVRRATGGAITLATAGVVIALIAYAVWPGPTGGLVPYDPAFDGVAALSTGLEDPGAPGRFAFDAISYGSGSDRHRPAFGAQADLITPTVDAAAVLRPLDGGADAMRAWWWGFGTDALPLNGLAWVPRGDGPFPLVIIVHGNHSMGEFSEDGYAYLGEHLASRGFIAASIDEDFLNGSWTGEYEGSEQPVRAWLLLLHVDQWRTWNEDPATPLHGRVDMDRVALIGHSRGGEASSVAAMLADDDLPPLIGMEPWPTDLGIRAVVSIAPSDGQYGTPPQLAGVDFLTLQGGYDSDATAWSGIRQYARTTPRDDGFKAAFWTYRSNHGQFNTVWGRGDHGPFSGTQLNLAPILPAEAQQDIARTTIGAFLEASLHDEDGYRGLFQRPMTGREWLPEDIYLTRSAASEAVVDPLTAGGPDRAVDGARITSDGFTTTSAMHIPLRALQPDQAARAVMARWSAGAGTASWGIDGIDDAGLRPGPDAALRFAIADGTRTDAGPTAPIDITVEVSDRDGTAVAIPLATFGALPPPLPVQLAKHDVLIGMTDIDLTLRSPAERVLQTYAIPLAAFEAADPAFEAADLTGFRLTFDRTTAGAVWIADVALVR